MPRAATPSWAPPLCTPLPVVGAPARIGPPLLERRAGLLVRDLRAARLPVLRQGPQTSLQLCSTSSRIVHSSSPALAGVPNSPLCSEGPGLHPHSVAGPVRFQSCALVRPTDSDAGMRQLRGTRPETSAKGQD
eukprot:scaffold765_cov345-Prasinococcus_capsulatus_cf.AAC.2